MKTPEQIAETFRAALARLPKYVDPARVTCEADRLRVKIDGRLVREFGHGVCGWIGVELGLGTGRDGAAVLRALQAACKAHP